MRYKITGAYQVGGDLVVGRLSFRFNNILLNELNCQLTTYNVNSPKYNFMYFIYIYIYIILYKV